MAFNWQSTTQVPALPTELISNVGTAALLNTSAMNQQMLGQLAATALTGGLEIKRQKDFLDAQARENRLAREEDALIRKSNRRLGLAQTLGALGTRMAGGQLGISGNQMSSMGVNDLLASVGGTLGLANQIGSLGDVSRYTSRPWELVRGMGSGGQ